MANVNAPNGFVPYRHLHGGVIRAREYQIAAAYNTNIFSGDVVKLDTSGVIQLATPGDTTLLGIFEGCQWFDPDGSVRFSRYWPASQAVKTGTTPTAYVFSDPGISYKVQTFTGTNFVQAMVGANADFKANTAGSTLTGSSGEELDLASVVATTANFRIVGLVNEPGNALGDRAKVEVLFVETLTNPAGTIGV